MPNDSAADRTTERVSLIERAAERLHSQTAAARPPKAAPVAEQPSPAPSRQRAPTPQRTIEIDYRRLANLGHITPDTMTTHLAEEIRLIKRSLLTFARASDHSRRNVVLVSSADPGAGKSFLSLNLALSIACEYDTGALLIDADTERPQIFERLGVDDGIGLLDLLADAELDVRQAVVATDLDRLALLGPGRGSDFASELLGSNRMHEVVAELSSRYPDRLIILDSAPLLACAGAAELTRLAGQVLFVVEADSTERGAIDAALELIPEDCQVQLVLNKNRARVSMRAPYYNYGRRRDRAVMPAGDAAAESDKPGVRPTVPPKRAGSDVS